MDLYTEAHLFAAAVRILHHRKGTQPSVDDLCAMLDISTEHGLSVARKLAAKGILETFEDPFSIRLGIGNHLLIEELPRAGAKESSISDELARFMAKKKSEEKKIETIQAELDKKKKSMFSDIEKKLKKQFSGDDD